MANEPKPGSAAAPNTVEQAVARAVRDNLERIQRTSDELHQAVADLVAACASQRPTNALPPMLRAETAAASLSAALEVLSRFIAASMQAAPRSSFEAEISRIAGAIPAAPVAAAAAPVSYAEPPPAAGTGLPPAGPASIALHAAEAEAESTNLAADAADAAIPEHELAEEFNVNRLSPEEQELHRRANRVAKVSMQDIKMLRPDQVRLGRENKDLCLRLKDDIEKAHREYDRRFRPIMDHPVDYFYRWMVEILGDGDAHTLGEYPYATTARPR
jgi:hypothetical protein